MENRQPPKQFSEEIIRQRAHKLYEDRLHKTSQDDWTDAERQLLCELEAKESKKFRKEDFLLENLWNSAIRSRQITFVADFLDKAPVARILSKLFRVIEVAGAAFVPIFLWWLSQSYIEAQDQLEEQQFQLEVEQLQHETVQNYLNRLGDRLLEIDLRNNDDAREITEADTLDLLRYPDLTGIRKRRVIRVLLQLNLIQNPISRDSSRNNLEQIRVPVISLSEVDLGRAEVNNLNLEGVDFSRAILTDSNFRKSSLDGANLQSSKIDYITCLNEIQNTKHRDIPSIEDFNITDDRRFAIPYCVDFSESSLKNADLRNIELPNATFFKADLSNANLSNADLRGANLHETNLSIANFRNADLGCLEIPKRYLFSSISFCTNLEYANLARANLNSTNLDNARLDSANLSFANLTFANLKRARLTETNLSFADLSDAILSFAKFESADTWQTKFDRANLYGADLGEVRNLTKEQLSLAKLCKTNLPYRLPLNPDRNCEE